MVVFFCDLVVGSGILWVYIVSCTIGGCGVREAPRFGK